MNDNSLDNLLDQLRTAPKEEPSNTADEEAVELTSENVEDFLLKYAGKLVKGSVESVENMKDFIDSAPDADHSEALASLIRSASSSMDVLQKLLIAKNRNDNTIEVTKMKIESQQLKTNKEVGAQLLLSREEMLKELMDRSETAVVVESEIVDDKGESEEG